MDSACLHMSKRRSKLLLSDATLRHNWRIDKRSLTYEAAFAQAWQIHIADK
jgi:hypothetical protein